MPGINDEIISIVEIDNGTIWIGTQAGSVIRLKPNGNDQNAWGNYQIDRFDDQHGLAGGGVYVTDINNTPYFTALDAVYRFEPL